MVINRLEVGGFTCCRKVRSQKLESQKLEVRKLEVGKSEVRKVNIWCTCNIIINIRLKVIIVNISLL